MTELEKITEENRELKCWKKAAESRINFLAYQLKEKEEIIDKIKELVCKKIF